MVENQSITLTEKLVSTTRTARYFALQQISGSFKFLHVTNVNKQVTLDNAPVIETSILDDTVLVQTHANLENPKFFNVENGKEEPLLAVSDSVGCIA